MKNFSFLIFIFSLPTISAPLHPDQTQWYQETVVRLHFDFNEESEYSFILSRDPLEEPDQIPDRPWGELQWIGDMEYADLEDGVYYFSIKECRRINVKEACSWGPAARFRMMIDSTSPEPFTPSIEERDGQSFVVFQAVDLASGIDHYEVNGQRGESPFMLSREQSKNSLAVKAVDKAGNERTVELAVSGGTAWEKIRLWILAVVLIGGVLWWRRKTKK